MCLLVIFVVVAYDVLVIQPFSRQNLVPGAQYLGTRDSLSLITQPWSVTTVGVLIQRLTLSHLFNSSFLHPTMYESMPFRFT